MYFNDYDCDTSNFYEPTYSGDERIETFLKQQRDEEITIKKLEDLNRAEKYEDFFRDKEDDVFKLPGLTFLKFTNSKIKFSFVPSTVTKYVSKKVIFYCSIQYYEKYRTWNIKRDSFPVNIKLRIYRFFYRGDYFNVDDELIINTIFKIYEQFIRWTNAEYRFRLEKFERYQQGQDIFLDSDDEELFLDESRRRKLHEKRDKIWRRMLPPAR